MANRFSWIGLYYHTLQNSNKSTVWVLVSLYFFYSLFINLMYAVRVYWNFLLFNKSYNRSLSNEFYDLIYWTEFLSILFLRTRSSLKFVPRITILMMVMFIYYFQHTIYGFYELAISILRFGIYAVFGYFLLTFEIPALQWNSSYHYTPSLQSPRTLYFPVFSLAWIHDLPPIWTMFYPLFGRSHFSTEELALVDGNHVLLQQRLHRAQEAINLNPEILVNMALQDPNAGGEEPPNIVIQNNNEENAQEGLVGNDAQNVSG